MADNVASKIDERFVSGNDVPVTRTHISLDEWNLIKKSICIYCREELGNMNFENDQEAVDYILSFGED